MCLNKTLYGYQAKQSSHDDGRQREQDVGHPRREAVLLGDGGVKVAKDHRHLKVEDDKSSVRSLRQFQQNNFQASSTQRWKSKKASVLLQSS